MGYGLNFGVLAVEETRPGTKVFMEGIARRIEGSSVDLGALGLADALPLQGACGSTNSGATHADGGAEDGGQINVNAGGLPLAIVSLGDMALLGPINVHASGDVAVAGGFGTVHTTGSAAPYPS
jgi:hypothetical protein